jgi:PAS domain S-box-containing protein
MVEILIDQLSEDIVETIHEPLLVLDSDLKVLLANRSFIDSFKVTREETLGNFIYDLGNKQWDIPKLRELLETILPEKTTFDNYEVEHDFATIGKRTMILNARQVERAMGKERIILLAIEDITERKRLEGLLTESEERYRRLFETANDGIVLLEKGEGKITHANPAAEKMLGYTQKESIGNKLQDIGVLLDLGDFQTTMQILNKNGIIKYDNVPVKTKAEQHIDTDIYLVDRAKLVQCNIRDITERKQAELALQESEERYRMLFEGSTQGILATDFETRRFVFANPSICRMLGYSEVELLQLGVADIYPKDSLDHVISEIESQAQGEKPLSHEIPCLRKDGTIFLADITGSVTEVHGRKCSVGFFMDITERKRMEEEVLKIEKLESVGILAGGLAHDFNNILTTIMGNVSLAKMDIERGSQTYEVLEEVERASYRARDLTQQLLTFAKGGAPVKETASLLEVIKEATDFVLRGSGVRCDLSIPEDPWPVEIDSGQINQVINNLIINAKQAMPDGGVIQIQAGNMRVEAKHALPLEPGRYIKLSIQDQGVGITPRHLLKIFDPYFSTKQEGSGLGLAMVFSIVKQHNGHITVDSELDVGTTFHIYLPASEKAVSETREQQLEPIKGHGKILVMDDEESLRNLARQVLERLGYDVRLAAEGDEAIEQYKNARESGEPFDAVILDLTIPGGIGGRKTIKRLKEIDPEVKAIVASGYSNDPVMANFKEYGFSGYISKPYRIDKLGQVVHEVLSGIGK